jgi:hypothetical protein
LACHLQIIADPDSDPVYHVIADPDADPVPFLYDADPDPDFSCHKVQNTVNLLCQL